MPQQLFELIIFVILVVTIVCLLKFLIQILQKADPEPISVPEPEPTPEPTPEPEPDLGPTPTPTQQAMIDAIRAHPEGCQSTDGEFDPVLQRFAEEHAIYMAKNCLQNHANFERRYHEMRDEMGGGLSPVEIVAESWGKENLEAACMECVRSWRRSSGHWNVAVNPHKRYAYDIRQDVNGKWYSCGLIAD